MEDWMTKNDFKPKVGDIVYFKWVDSSCRCFVIAVGKITGKLKGEEDIMLVKSGNTEEYFMTKHLYQTPEEAFNAD